MEDGLEIVLRAVPLSPSATIFFDDETRAEHLVESEK